MSKDLWFAEMEELMAEGHSYDSACDKAYGRMTERLYDHADYMRKRAREENALTAAPPGAPLNTKE